MSRTEQSGPSWPEGAALGPALVSWVIGPGVGQPCPGAAHCASVLVVGAALGSVQLAFGRGECWGEFFQELLFVEKYRFWGGFMASGAGGVGLVVVGMDWYKGRTELGGCSASCRGTEGAPGELRFSSKLNFLKVGFF